MTESSMAEIGKELLKLEVNAKHIRRVSFIMNTILGNACYSDKERDAQINKGEKLGNLDDRELKLLNDGWDLRNKLTKNLMTGLETLVVKCNKMDGL